MAKTKTRRADVRTLICPEPPPYSPDFLGIDRHGLIRLGHGHGGRGIRAHFGFRSELLFNLPRLDRPGQAGRHSRNTGGEDQDQETARCRQ